MSGVGLHAGGLDLLAPAVAGPPTGERAPAPNPRRRPGPARRRATRVACVAALVLAAGCGGTSATSPAATSATAATAAIQAPPSAAPSAGVNAATGAAPTSAPGPSAAPASAAAEATPAVGVSGTWSGTWTRTAPAATGALTLKLTQQGPALDGSITLVGSLCLPQGAPLTGTLQGSSVTLAVNANGTVAAFEGTLAGTSLSGTMTVTCGGLTGQGTWKAAKT